MLRKDDVAASAHCSSDERLGHFFAAVSKARQEVRLTIRKGLQEMQRTVAFGGVTPNSLKRSSDLATLGLAIGVFSPRCFSVYRCESGEDRSCPETADSGVCGDSAV